MLREGPASQFDRLLYRLRSLLAAVTLLFIFYYAVYLWFFVPYEDFSYAWRPDSRLVVIDVPDESLAAPYLRPGDEVLEIGDQPIVRMRPVYPLPLQTTYEYKVLRNGVVQTHTISFSTRVTPLSIQLRLPATVLSLAGWFVGAIMLHWARADNRQAIQAGFIFLFAGASAIGIYAALNGVPGAWVAGYALLFFLAPAWTYLGLFPRMSPLKPRSRTLFKVLLVLAGGLALIAVFEVLALYPRSTSVEELIGVSIYAMGLLLSGLGLLVSIIILSVRALRMPRSSYLRRQITILLAFIGLGTLPIVLFTILPAVLFDVIILPFPLTISLMLLIPAGYLFVIYRRGLLGLDLFFSRTLHLILLSLVVFGFYATTLYLAQRLLSQNGAGITVSATVVFLPTLVLAAYLNKPVNGFVDRLVYGNVAYSQEALADYTLALSSRPELSTLDDIVASLAKTLSCHRASLALKDETGSLMTISVVGVDPIPDTLPDELRGLGQPMLRSAAGDRKDAGSVFRLLPWAEILVPVTIRNEQIGLLALSRPGPDGFFNSKQVSFLTRAVGVLAVGAENITLFDSTRQQSRQRQMVQEEERKTLSRQLHDDPLQKVTYAINVIDQLLTKHVSAGYETLSEQSDGLAGLDAAAKLAVASDNLRQAATSLRKVCIGLYPPFYDQGVELAVKDVIYHFESEYGLKIRYNSSLNEAKLATSEQVTAAVCRILNESLNNVLKHAGGADVCVTLKGTGEGRLVLSVADTGPGSWAGDLSFSELIRRHHLGIVGMHEWAQQIGGELQILPNKPRGTEVLLHCPLQSQPTQG